MPLIRQFSEIAKLLGGVTPAEEKLVAACLAGDDCYLGSDLPSKIDPTETRRIRADVLHFLITGGCDACKVSSRGVVLVGGHITGQLDLSFAKSKGSTSLIACLIEEPIISQQSELERLDLSYSRLVGFDAQDAKIAGGVSFIESTVSDSVNLDGVEIGGSLYLSGAKLTTIHRPALSAILATIKGHIFANSVTSKSTLTFEGANIDGTLNFKEARFDVNKGSALEAEGIQIRGDLFLNDIITNATIDLNSAQVGGQLQCSNAVFGINQNKAINAPSAKIKGRIFLDYVKSNSLIDFNGAEIGGQLECEYARLKSTDGIALDADSAHIQGDILLNETVVGATIDLSGAVIDGTLQCTHVKFEKTGGVALAMDGAKVRGSVCIRNTTAAATISLDGAEIGGLLGFEETQLQIEDGKAALDVQRAKINDGVYLVETVSNSRVRFDGAEIRGELDCSDAKLEAVEAQNTIIKENVFFNRTHTTASINLRSATIGGGISCSDAKLKAADGEALIAQQAQIGGSIYLSNTLAKATIDLDGAQIGGQLSLVGTQLEATDGDALTAENAKIQGGINFFDLNTPQRPVSFRYAHTSVLLDDPTCWPEVSFPSLDGFTYDRIDTETQITDRIEWLKNGSYWDSRFCPQPYTQLAKVLRETGHDSDARKVLSKREQLILLQTRMDKKIIPNGDVDIALLSMWRDFSNLLRFAFDLLLRWVVGYGHQPFRSLIVLLLLICVAVLPAHFAWEEGSFAPNSGPMLTSVGWLALYASEDNPAKIWSGDAEPVGWSQPGATAIWRDIAPGRDWETFNRYAYAVDVVIPIVDIGQTNAWAPSTTRGPWGWHLWWLKGVLSVFGWIATALGAAAITGIIRRD